MKLGQTLFAKDRNNWRDWLEANYDKEKEIWLIYYKKHTGKISIPYDDAVEEALCFEWIDGLVKKLDEERYIQRFTPRNPKSLWSESNIKRVKKMIREEKMAEVGLKLYKDAMARKQVVPTVSNFKIPSDLKKALMKIPGTWKNFNKLSPSDQLLYSYWVDSAKRDVTKEKRIRVVVERSLKNLKPQWAG